MTLAIETRGLGEIVLFLRALRLVRLAQQVSTRPVDQVARRMTELSWLPRNLSPRAAGVAADRAGRWWSRLTTGRNSCLIRTLVTGAMLADRPGVVLHVGFRPSTGNGVLHDGHAWLTVDGRDMPEGSSATGPGEPYTESLAIPLARVWESR